MSNYNNTTLADILKVINSKDYKEDLIFKEKPLLDWLPKDTSFAGSTLDYPLYAEMAPTFGVTEADTIALLDNAPVVQKVSIDIVQAHAWRKVSRQIIKRTKNDAGAFYNAIKKANDEPQIELSQELGFSLYRSGYGELDTIKSNDSSKTVTLTNPRAARAFKKGQKIVFAAAISSGTLRDSGGSLTVNIVNVNEGKISFVEDLSTISGLANGDVMFLKGTRQNVASPTRLRPTGLAAWGPTSAVASGDSFHGIDRSLDSRFQFCFVSASMNSPMDAIRKGVLRLSDDGKSADRAFCDPDFMDRLLAQAGGQVQRMEEGKLRLGFQGVTVAVPGGTMDIVSDANCQKGQVWLLKKDTLSLVSMGDMIELVDEDGLKSRFASDSNDIVIRYESDVNLKCSDPCSNCVISLV